MRLRIDMLAIVMLLITFVQPSYATSPNNKNCITAHILSSVPQKMQSISDADIKLTLALEMAATPKARERGLMGRKTLAPCNGMAFFFPPVPDSDHPTRFAPQKFWMKDTLIPLDILFVDEAGKIISIATATPLSLQPIGPDAPVATVIEIAGGRAKGAGITAGDKVLYELENSPWNIAR